MQDRCYRCGKQQNLKKCKYCNEYFCDEHLPAKMCLTRRSLEDKTISIDIRNELEKEWRKEGGHPDTEYTSQRWKKFERKEKEYHESVSKFLDKKTDIIKTPLRTEGNIKIGEASDYTPINPFEHTERKQRKSFRFPSNRLIIFLIIAAAIAYFIFLAPQETKNNLSVYLQGIEDKASASFKNLTSSVSQTLTPKPGFNSDTYETEKLVFQEINEERKKYSLSELIWDPMLADVARKHSLDMANKSYFSHDNFEGQGPTERAEERGRNVVIDKGLYQTIGIGENIGEMPTGNIIGCGGVYSPSEISSCMMDGWMNSAGHRANILDREYQFVGVGVAYNGLDTYYLTQDFQ